MSLLLTLLFIKHFFADFVLQTNWMVRGKGLPSGENWVEPLICHSAIHSVLSFAVLACFSPLYLAFSVAIIEGFVHFGIDRVKASPNLLGRYKDISRKAFWWALGGDQLAHGLCYIIIASLTL